MKKIILAIFLVLGAVSFAAPKYVDMAKLQKNSYQIIQDEEGARESDFFTKEDVFLFGKSTEDVGLTVALFDVPESKDTAKKLSEEVKTTAPADQKYVSSRENKRAYIIKFKAKDGSYTYSFVGKKPKVKNCYISTLYITNKDFKDNELDKVADQTLNEIESYLK